MQQCGDWKVVVAILRRFEVDGGSVLNKVYISNH
ncbi:hypothetical protein ISN45_At03g025640 [Arabidopsis thaliana x Arabidopsis arenosa]|uniref:Uncharacterized protein n=1 Tax=Arabidopsis thaliana x Arabidopsis arenosa TaxID=1240361 RepID=A0A8T2EVM3_9BRAS|nr:hypothetical protein ISN45_At03g025640 [Arabidopsis thaliana x Arabidopsis arenosa]